MRIATWNLRRPGGTASPRHQRLLEWIARLDADVWILTETRDTFTPPGYQLCATTDGRDPQHAAGERWTMIWSRLPVVSIEKTVDPNRAAFARLKLDGERTLAVYGTVLPWRSDLKYSPLKGAAAFTAALKEQESDWLRHREQHPDDLLCVAGDFNQELGGSSYAGTKRGRDELRRALSTSGLACHTGESNDPIRKIESKRGNIDHVCLDDRLTNNVRGVGAWPNSVGELKGLTDHFGVWVDLLI